MLFNLHYYGFQTIEKCPFEISRPEGSPRFIFFHFTSSVKMRINNQLVDVHPGSCIIFEPRFPQYFVVKNNNLNHDYLDFTCDDVSFFKGIRFPLNTIITPSMSNFISNSMEKIHAESNSSRLGSEYIIQSAMENLFVSISRRIHHFSFNSLEYEKTLQKKFEQVRLNLYHTPGDFKVKQMAEKLDFSISHFEFLYKKFFTVNPIDDLTIARKQFIDNNIIVITSIYEMIEKLGFSSVEYYYRWFKKNFGVTPKKYREIILMERLKQ